MRPTASCARSCSAAIRRRRASRRSSRGAALAGVHVEAHGSDETFEEYERELEQLAADAELGGPVPRADVPALFARSHVLINNMRAGAPDKVVYEAAASCLPVLASNPVFDDLLPPELRFDRDDPESLAERLRTLDRRRRPELRELVARNHSVEHWADGLLATVGSRMKSDTILHLQKVAGISGSEAHLLSLLPRLRERGWDVRMLMLHENEPGAWDFAARCAPAACRSMRSRCARTSTRSRSCASSRT